MNESESSEEQEAGRGEWMETSVRGDFRVGRKVYKTVMRPV